MRGRELALARRLVRTRAAQLRRAFPPGHRITVRWVHRWPGRAPQTRLGECHFTPRALNYPLTVYLSAPNHGNAAHALETLEHEWAHALLMPGAPPRAQMHGSRFWLQLGRISSLDGHPADPPGGAQLMRLLVVLALLLAWRCTEPADPTPRGNVPISYAGQLPRGEPEAAWRSPPAPSAALPLSGRGAWRAPTPASGTFSMVGATLGRTYGWTDSSARLGAWCWASDARRPAMRALEIRQHALRHRHRDPQPVHQVLRRGPRAR